jgi:hypothetical protein
VKLEEATLKNKAGTPFVHTSSLSRMKARMGTRIGPCNYRIVRLADDRDCFKALLKAIQSFESVVGTTDAQRPDF